MKLLLIVDTILRNREKFFGEIRRSVDLRGKIRAMLISGLTFLAIAGLVMGASHSVWQALASMIKLPFLFFVTLAICMPSLHFFNVLFGSKQTVWQTAALLLTAIAVAAVLLFSFAPIVLFFLISSSRYEFFKLLNVVFCSVAGILGVRFLRQGMRLVADANSPDGRSTRGVVGFAWTLVFGFVGTQMAWTLRPFVGDPTKPFILFLEPGGNIYSDVVTTLGQLFFR